MQTTSTTIKDSQRQPHYARASAVCAYFQISRSTLWNWCKSRNGFPQPLKAGAKVTLFDINAIDKFIKSDSQITSTP
jgi:predicted DNA-binding transcriptional regulator AlpA